MTNLHIVHVVTAAEAASYLGQGFCPVECSMGSSVVDGLQMDHHGEYSALEGVAVRAYRDHFGARRDDPRFVVTGFPDADAAFCIASLIGILPHPSRAAEFEKAPPPVKAANTRDLSALAELINRVDIAPIGIRLEEEEGGDTLLLFNQLSNGGSDVVGFYGAVSLWRQLTTGRPLNSLLSAAKEEEADRVVTARQAKVMKIADVVSVVESAAWGFDVWYAEQAPIIVAWVPASQNITIGCPDNETAEKFFGPGGLKNVFSKLLPEGWRGREAIGGSPRGAKLTFDDAMAAAQIIASLVIAKS